MAGYWGAGHKVHNEPKTWYYCLGAGHSRSMGILPTKTSCGSVSRTELKHFAQRSYDRLVTLLPPQEPPRHQLVLGQSSVNLIS